LKTLKTILCISALLVLTASTADAYVRRAVGGGYVARGGYHPVARGVARGAAVAAGTAAVAATGGYGWGGGWGTGYAAGPVAQPYQASVYGQGWNYGGDAPGTCYRDCDNYRKMLRESGYNVKNYRSAAGTVKQTAY